MKLRVFEAFSGVGSQKMALDNLPISYEVVATSEIDKNAIKSYGNIHKDILAKVPEVTSGLTKEDMVNYLESIDAPLNPKTFECEAKKLKEKELKQVYTACKLTKNLGNIAKINTEDIPDHDLFTYSFPCQDISVAGKQAGLDMGSGSRSGLLWECQKVISVKRPKYLLLENVKNLVGKSHKHNFDMWLEWLESQGYTNYWKILNGNDFGLPQKRERVFVVSVLGGNEYKFPEPTGLVTTIKDILEENVPEKYYLPEGKVRLLIEGNKESIYKYFSNPKPNCPREIKGLVNMVRVRANEVDTERLVDCLRSHRTTPTKEIALKLGKPATMVEHWFRKDKYFAIPEADCWYELKELLGIKTDEFDSAITEYEIREGVYEKANRVYDPDYVAPTLTTQGDHKIIIGDTEKLISETLYAIGASRGRDIYNPGDRSKGNPNLKQRLEINQKGISNTITSVQKDNYMVEATVLKQYEDGLLKQELGAISQENEETGGLINNIRIRKLTPLESWRLMGFSDFSFKKAQEVCSNTHLYKQAGNSICVPVLEAIFYQLYIGTEYWKTN